MSVVVITGASQGIGRALAVLLVEKGLQVIGVARQADALLSLQKTVGTAFIPVCADVSLPKDRERIVAAVPKNTRELLLVHNAGLLAPFARLRDVTLADFQQSIAVNVEAPLFLTQALLDPLSGGRVLHIGSGAAHLSLPSMNTYCVAKGALHHLYQCWKSEIENYDIAFASCSPGAVDTPMFSQLLSKECERAAAYESVKNKTLTPLVAATFIAWLLLTVERERFSETEWNIYDDFHHEEWAQGACVKNPF